MHYGLAETSRPAPSALNLSQSKCLHVRFPGSVILVIVWFGKLAAEFPNPHVASTSQSCRENSHIHTTEAFSVKVNLLLIRW